MSGLLVHSPAEVVGQMLIDLTYGTEPELSLAWPVYVTNEPTLPDNCITVRDTQGTDDGRTMPDGERQEHHGVQVRVRATSPAVGHPKINAIAIALDQQVYNRAVSVGGHVYLVQSVSRSGQVLPLGKEYPSSKRSLFTLNALVTVRQRS